MSNSETNQALLSAVQDGDAAAAQAALDNRADANCKTEAGLTPLHFAASMGHAAVVGPLLAGGADVGAKDPEDGTALHWAARQGQAAVVGPLLAGGADVGAKDSDGKTALDLARAEGNAGCVAALEEWSAKTPADMAATKAAPPAGAPAVGGGVAAIRTLSPRHSSAESVAGPSSADARAKTAKQTIAVVITTGSNDPLKTELAVLSGFGARKNGHDVYFIMMGEAGGVVDEDLIRQCNGFGLPPIAKLLDDAVMEDVMWYVWKFCVDARKQGIDTMKRKGKLISAVEGAALMAAADKCLVF